MNEYTRNELARIRSDFRRQIEEVLKKRGLSRCELAKAAGITSARVTQILDGRGNIRTTTIVRIVLALHLKVSIVAHENETPLAGEVLSACWNKKDRPTNLFFGEAEAKPEGEK